MNQFEELREQCAAICDEVIKNTSNPSFLMAFEIISDKIRALPLPEVKQKPAAWLRKDTMQKLIDKPSGTAGFGATLFFNETALHTEPLYALPPDVEALRKENEQLKESLRYVIEESEAWAYECHGYKEIDTEEMKLAKERAK